MLDADRRTCTTTSPGRVRWIGCPVATAAKGEGFRVDRCSLVSTSATKERSAGDQALRLDV